MRSTDVLPTIVDHPPTGMSDQQQAMPLEATLAFHSLASLPQTDLVIRAIDQDREIRELREARDGAAAAYETEAGLHQVALGLIRDLSARLALYEVEAPEMAARIRDRRTLAGKTAR